MITRMFQLKDEIQQLMEEKSYSIDEFIDSEWIYNFAFLADIASYFSKFILAFKGRVCKLIVGYVRPSQSLSSETIFLGKTDEKNLAHSPTLLNCEDQNTKKYANLISKLIKEF